MKLLKSKIKRSLQKQFLKNTDSLKSDWELYSCFLILYIFQTEILLSEWKANGECGDVGDRAGERNS